MDVSGRPEAWTIKYWSITRIAGCSLLEEVKYERGPTDKHGESESELFVQAQLGR